LLVRAERVKDPDISVRLAGTSTRLLMRLRGVKRKSDSDATTQDIDAIAHELEAARIDPEALTGDHANGAAGHCDDDDPEHEGTA
jgi:hypothetical protein